jgi:CpXC protein
MAVYHKHTVKCVCGQVLLALLADSINVKRAPEARDKILRGELHKGACQRCGRHMTVEKPFYYTDLERNALFKVLPRGERHLWKKASRELDAASNLVPHKLISAEGRTLRVVFGMDELREKLVAQDAGLDDRLLELLKVLLVYEHPILLRWTRLRLMLEAVTEDGLDFRASYEHNQRRFRLRMPRQLVEDLIGKADTLKAWAKRAHPKASVFELPDHWVNLWRWSPQPSALERLREYAQQINDGQEIDTTTVTFTQMLDLLPRGMHLPAWAKQSVHTLFKYAERHGLQSLEDKLFEVRFGFELEDDWSINEDLQDIDTLWQLLQNLPDTNVEGNTMIHEIFLELGQGGGLYDPSSHDISIGSDELTDKERFEGMVLHEVGHAVHEQKSELVNSWLESEFGWRTFGIEEADIDEWVRLMGGWGPLTEEAQRRDVREVLLAVLGEGGAWEPLPEPELPAGHPWKSKDFGPRLAVEKTGADWYKHFKTWYRVNDKAFFLNYWYQTFIAVDVKTLDLIALMPDAYASMSHYEFFAELYALYYDSDSPQRSVIMGPISKWFDENIGAPETEARSAKAAPPKRKWETAIRPGKHAKEE